MVALDSRDTPDPPSGLAPATIQRLREALRGHIRGERGCAEQLTQALRSASNEARVAGLRPEHLIIALKQLAREAEEGEPGLLLLEEDRRKLRETLVTATLKAYFGS